MTIEFLKVCKQIKNQIVIETEKLTQLKRLVTTITNEINGLPRSQDKTSKVEKLAASIVDTENKINQLKNILAECLSELAEKLMVLIENATIRQVILYRYGYCKPFRSIADTLGFCERRIYKYHSAGLNILKSSLDGQL